MLPGLRPALSPSKWLEEDGLTHLAKWLEAVTTRASVVETLPPADELQTSYKRLVERFASMGAGAPR